jgi:hypothetical protein
MDLNRFLLVALGEAFEDQVKYDVRPKHWHQFRYVSPIMISVWNRSPLGTDPIVIKPGECIAQMIFVPILRPTFEMVQEFSGAANGALVISDLLATVSNATLGLNELS